MRSILVQGGRDTAMTARLDTALDLARATKATSPLLSTHRLTASSPSTPMVVPSLRGKHWTPHSPQTTTWPKLLPDDWKAMMCRSTWCSTKPSRLKR